MFEVRSTTRVGSVKFTLYLSSKLMQYTNFEELLARPPTDIPERIQLRTPLQEDRVFTSVVGFMKLLLQTFPDRRILFVRHYLSQALDFLSDFSLGSRGFTSRLRSVGRNWVLRRVNSQGEVRVNAEIVILVEDSLESIVPLFRGPFTRAVLFLRFPILLSSSNILDFR